MKSFLVWLTSPPRALAQANAEIEYLRSENRRLNDLLTQVYENARVVPVQKEHLQQAPPEVESPKTLGEMQRDFSAKRIADYQQWQRDEEARLERQREAGDAASRQVN